MTYLLIVSVFFLLAGLQALGLAWFGLRGFSYERSFSRPAAYEGESVELIEVIQNRSPFFLPWVRVETSISTGLPAFDVVGLPDVAVKESRERVRAAVKNSGFAFPGDHITVNLAPADKK